ncbi:MULTISPECIES: hypothetical protein [Labrys]|uniref:Uncharacterized protein n=1 Tax=Labrys neptuniae TaxID=376174 RepID=A0ABV3PWF3_9HYPH
MNDHVPLSIHSSIPAPFAWLTDENRARSPIRPGTIDPNNAGSRPWETRASTAKFVNRGDTVLQNPFKSMNWPEILASSHTGVTPAAKMQKKIMRIIFKNLYVIYNYI